MLDIFHVFISFLLLPNQTISIILVTVLLNRFLCFENNFISRVTYKFSTLFGHIQCLHFLLMSFTISITLVIALLNGFICFQSNFILRVTYKFPALRRKWRPPSVLFTSSPSVLFWWQLFWTGFHSLRIISSLEWLTSF